MYGHRALTSLSLTEMAYLEREKAINKHNIDRIYLIPLYSSRVHGKYTWESQTTSQTVQNKKTTKWRMKILTATTTIILAKAQTYRKIMCIHFIKAGQ